MHEIRISITATIFGAALVCAPLCRAADEPLTSLLKVIKPAPDEDRWAKIAWRTDLWEARKEAAAKGKPILLWEMDGHPLGCV